MGWALETEAVVRRYRLDSLKGKEKEKFGQDGRMKYLQSKEKKKKEHKSKYYLF